MDVERVQNLQDTHFGEHLQDVRKFSVTQGQDINGGLDTLQ